MIFYKVILYGVNFVLPHSMSAKSKIKFLVLKKKEKKQAVTGVRANWGEISEVGRELSKAGILQEGER